MKQKSPSPETPPYFSCSLLQPPIGVSALPAFGSLGTFAISGPREPQAPSSPGRIAWTVPGWSHCPMPNALPVS